MDPDLDPHGSAMRTPQHGKLPGSGFVWRPLRIQDPNPHYSITTNANPHPLVWTALLPGGRKYCKITREGPQKNIFRPGDLGGRRRTVPNVGQKWQKRVRKTFFNCF